MALTPGYATVTHDGYTVDSNRASEAEIRAALEAPSVEEEKAKAAVTLGKEGGKKSAEARKQRAVAGAGEGDEGEPDESGKGKEPPKTTEKKAAPAAKAAEKQAAPAAKAKKEPTEKQKAQRVKMKSCTKDASDKKLKGDERKKFMSNCMKS